MRDSLPSVEASFAVTCLLLLLFCRHLGKVAFVGPVHYAKGTYVGVVMDLAAVGKNDGEY